MKISNGFCTDRVIMRYEAQRLTKDGRLLDVVIRAAIFSISRDEPAGQIVILRNVTHEKRMARINEALLHLSLALPQYPNLEDLLDYLNGEVKRLLNTEGAVVILLDEERGEWYFLGATFDEADTEKKVKEIRFPLDRLVAGKVLQTGKPLIVSDTTVDRDLHQKRDELLGYRTRNLILVPLKSVDRIIGVLCAINKKVGTFAQEDEELLSTLAGAVALSIENARVTQELQKAYQEVTSLNRAKNKALNHLSHELITPVAILSSSLRFLLDRNPDLKAEDRQSALKRIHRNLDRILELEYQLQDIMSDRPVKTQDLLSRLLDQSAEFLAAAVGELTGQEKLYKKIQSRIDQWYGPKEAVSREVELDQAVSDRLKALEPDYARREVNLITRLEPGSSIFLPPEVFPKVFDGLFRNAVENTPDGGRLEVVVSRKKDGALLRIHDYGQGITEENQKRIFEGFFPNQDVMNYSSGRPYDFNAGGKGGDLLRIKILSERFGFQVALSSQRCRFIPREKDLCPGRISLCPFCRSVEDCHQSGETIFSLYFPAPPKG